VPLPKIASTPAPQFLVCLGMVGGRGLEPLISCRSSSRVAPPPPSASRGVARPEPVHEHVHALGNVTQRGPPAPGPLPSKRLLCSCADAGGATATAMTTTTAHTRFGSNVRIATSRSRSADLHANGRGGRPHSSHGEVRQNQRAVEEDPHAVAEILDVRLLLPPGDKAELL